MTPCPICGDPVGLSELSFHHHYRKKHPGITPPNMSRRTVKRYEEADTYLIESAVKRREKFGRKEP